MMTFSACRTISTQSEKTHCSIVPSIQNSTELTDDTHLPTTRRFVPHNSRSINEYSLAPINIIAERSPTKTPFFQNYQTWNKIVVTGHNEPLNFTSFVSFNILTSPSIFFFVYSG